MDIATNLIIKGIANVSYLQKNYINMSQLF